jgi:glycolate oxidase
MATAVLPDVTERLRSLVGGDGVLCDPSDLFVYRRDASLFQRAEPRFVVCPKSTAEVQEAVRFCMAEKLPMVARGAGTGRFGHALSDGGVVFSTARMREIVEVNEAESYAVVQSGMALDPLNWHLKSRGLVFAPDPLSSASCTVGGCVATNARGPRSLKYGDTRANLLGLEVVTWDGRLVRLGKPAEDDAEAALMPQILGGEGRLGIVTRAWLKLVRPPAVREMHVTFFGSLREAAEAGRAVLQSPVSVCALELLDRTAIESLESMFHCRFPKLAQAMLFVECEGTAEKLAADSELLRCLGKQLGAREIRQPKQAGDNRTFWAWRLRALPALCRIANTCWLLNVRVPVDHLLAVATQIAAIAETHSVRIAQIAHVGDGLLHPVLMFDAAVPEQMQRARTIVDEIGLFCAAVDGSLRTERCPGAVKSAADPPGTTAVESASENTSD